MTRPFNALLCSFIILAGCSKKDDIPVHDAIASAPIVATAAAPLAASFTIVHQEQVKEGLPSQFVNNSISAVKYLWDFGTGDISTEKNPTYTFPGCGTRIVTLIAVDAAGNQKTMTIELNVLCGGKHAPAGG